MRGERWADVDIRQPKGTRHVETEIDLAERVVRHKYKVCWWYLPVYWLAMLSGTAKDGICVQVIRRPTVDTEFWNKELH